MVGSKFGGKVYDQTGEICLLELGPHVVLEVPGFAGKIGEIAAQWAHAEAELSSLLATLMQTSPERTFALLNPYKSAFSTADAANALGKATLQGDDLEKFQEVIADFRSIADQRNKIQHGLWAKKPNEHDCLYRAKAIDFTKYGINLLEGSNWQKAADDFEELASDKYTIARMNTLVDSIAELSLSIISTKVAYLTMVETTKVS
jgi:hypothetical protein